MAEEKFLDIVNVASEVSPYSTIGGLAMVARALPKSLNRLGHKVTIITPLYKSVKKKKWGLKKVIKNLKINLDNESYIFVSFWEAELAPGLKVYFLDHGKLFSEHLKIYGAKNEHQRFYAFNVATIELLLYLKKTPDIIQCHDWHTGLIPEMLAKRYHDTSLAKKTAVVFTIHNLTYQLAMGWWNVPVKHKDNGLTPIPPYNDKKLIYINFAKRGILYADIINTVSEQYAEEIMTKKFGQDLHRILKNRKGKLLGIVNGIEHNDYNPATDPGLIVNYDFNSLYLKTKNKTYLQEKFNLPVNPKIPLFGMVCRLCEQKGFNILLKIIEPLMRFNLQIIIWGGGDKYYEKEFKKIMKKYPDKFGANLELTTRHATQVYAGADFFLMPSRFEPCGLTQLEGMRYGVIPIVHAVGGLVDTISDYNPRTGKGNGFVFKTYDPHDLLVAITRAMENHRHKESWLRLVKSVMRQSYSWEIPAKKYVKLFKKAIYNKQHANNS